MHTGYDYNYWMYQNQRPEPVKIDSQPAFTDNHKPVQNMGVAGNFYNYAPPQNNIPKPRKKFPNDQQRMTNYQSMWPSSVHSVPFRCSQAQNFQPPERFPVPPTNRYESSQPVQNCNVQQFQNSNVNFPQVGNVNFKGKTGIGNNMNNQNANSPRIRVKDISSLSNFFDYNSLSEYRLTEPHQKKQIYNPFTSVSSAQNTLYNSETQKEQVNFDGSAVPKINQPYPRYGPPGTCTSHVNNDQQYQQSDSFYNQNAAYANDSQSQSNSIQQMEQQLTKTFNKSNYPALLPTQMKNNKTAQLPEMHSQVISHEVEKGNEVVTNQLRGSAESNASGNQSKSPGFTFSDLLDSSKMNTVSQFENQNQLSLPAISEDSQPSPVTPPTLPVTQSALNIPIKGPNIDKVQITIPRNGEATVISLVNSSFSETNKSSALCVYKGNAVGSMRRSSLSQESHKNVADTCKSSLPSPRAGFTCKTPGIPFLNIETCQQQMEPVVGCGINEQNIEISVIQDSCKQAAVKEATVCPRETGKLLATLKAENIDPAKEIMENEVTVIKIENDFCEESSEELTEKDIKPLQRNLQSSLGGTEKIDCSQSEPGGFGSESKTSADVKSIISRIQEFEIKKEPTANGVVETRGDQKNKIKFQSKINRNKLNMLINFLNEDEKSNEGQELNEKNQASIVIVENESTSKPNRRKISKTCVVKNKNNEREMISLVSAKSSKYSPALSTNNNDHNINELENDTENSNSSESTVIWEQSLEKKEKDFKESSQSGERPKKTTGINSSKKKVVTSEETKIISLMRAFQNLKDHFCANCDFASPVGSIWINVVSGELRCLNCFKKMISKSEENYNKDRKHVDSPSASKSESSQKANKGEKSGSGEGKNSKKKFNFETSHASIEIISKSKCEDEKNEEIRMKEAAVETHTDEVLRERDAIELSNKLKVIAFDGNGHIEKEKSSEEQKKTKAEDNVENLIKNSTFTSNSSKSYASRSTCRRERHSTDCKVCEKEHKSGKRRASEECAKPDSRHREEKSSKMSSVREEELKNDGKRMRNSTSPSHVPHKVRVVEEPLKKKEETHCQKEWEDYLKKEKKNNDFPDKLSKKVIPILKPNLEPTKSKEREAIDLAEKKNTSKEESVRRKSEEGEVSKNFKKEMKHERTKIKDPERKDQVTKVSHSKETSQGKKEEKIKCRNLHFHSQSQHEERDNLSKVFREKSNGQSNEKHIDKETHKSHEHRKEHKEKKRRNTSEENAVKKIRLDKVDAEKRKMYAKIFEKRQKEKKSSEEGSLSKSKADKAVSCSFEEILRQMDAFSKAKRATDKKIDANSMLARLMKKTKKVSQSLLESAE